MVRLGVGVPIGVVTSYALRIGSAQLGAIAVGAQAARRRRRAGPAATAAFDPPRTARLETVWTGILADAARGQAVA